MMPGIDPREDARKRRRVRLGFPIFFFVSAASAALLSGTRLHAWHWIPVILGITATAVFTAISMAASGYRPGGRGRGSGPSGRGRDNDGPTGAAPHQWHMLVMASLLMPRSAGRRWLAEAESLLSEVATARRGVTIRSYLLSAPRLVVMMWAREVLRRARLGPRRPG